MAIETIRGRYRLHRFPPRQRHLHRVLRQRITSAS